MPPPLPWSAVGSLSPCCRRYPASTSGWEAEARGGGGMIHPGSHSCRGRPWRAQAQLQYFPHQIIPWNILEQAHRSSPKSQHSLLPFLGISFPVLGGPERWVRGRRLLLLGDQSFSPSQLGDVSSATGVITLPCPVTQAVGQRARSCRRKAPLPRVPLPSLAAGSGPLTSMQGLQAAQLAVVGRLVQRQPAVLVGLCQVLPRLDHSLQSLFVVFLDGL